MFVALTAPLGSSDCEAIAGGWLLQPINAWSSLAYTVVGLALIASSGQSAPPERTLRRAFGLLTAATGVGSFLYHGPQSTGAGFAHDVTFLATLWFLVVMDPASSLGIRRRSAWLGLGGIIAAISVVLIVAPTSSNVLTGISIIALIVSDWLMHRIGGINGRWYATALSLFAASLLFNALGRSAASTCEPDAMLQFHALWHILSATALGAYFVAMTDPRSQEPNL